MTGRLLDHWSGPDWRRAPVACLATTFTFEPEFFTEDCLPRFLTCPQWPARATGSPRSPTLLEEEDQLSEVQVTVLVDRGYTGGETQPALGPAAGARPGRAACTRRSYC